MNWCVKKVLQCLDKKAIRWSVSLPTFFSDKRKFGRRQGENTANKHLTDSTSVDEFIKKQSNMTFKNN